MVSSDRTICGRMVTKYEEMVRIGRNDFSKPTIDAVANVQGFYAENLGCETPTIGANEVGDKSTTIGQAAHITAVTEGGPRV